MNKKQEEKYYRELNEKVEALKKDVTEMSEKYESMHSRWIDYGKENNDNYDDNIEAAYYKEYDDCDEALKQLKSILNCAELELKPKLYASKYLWSDVEAYEIIERRTPNLFIARRMITRLDNEASAKLEDSFVPGGFFGHFENSLQKWIYESDPNGETVELRRKKNGTFGRGRERWQLRETPYEFYDYNF